MTQTMSKAERLANFLRFGEQARNEIRLRYTPLLHRLFDAELGVIDSEAESCISEAFEMLFDDPTLCDDELGIPGSLIGLCHSLRVTSDTYLWN